MKPGARCKVGGVRDMQGKANIVPTGLEGRVFRRKEQA